MKPAEDAALPLPVCIAVAERETGLGKDTLRVWERRYGFPRPVRDAQGDRAYPRDQIERLRQIKRLIDLGHRPGRVVGASDAVLREFSGSQAALTGTAAGMEAVDGDFPAELQAMRSHDVDGLRRLLSQHLARNGLERLVTQIVPGLNAAVGSAWSNGRLAIFEEHLYTEQIQSLLRQAIGALPPGMNRPRVLLSTVPGEQHTLGLLIVEALLALRGIRVISLGAQTPLTDLAAAARAHGADIVALSFSGAFPTRQLLPVVSQLRNLLPTSTRIWIGGTGCRRFAKPLPGVERLEDLTLLDRLLGLPVA